MEYEIEFLPVGDASSSGDAICLRYSSDQGATWHVGVIDGGTQASGEALCKHIQTHYGTETVDFLICTHPDQDHASGLSNVMEQLTVKKLLMHCPWDYVDYFFDSVNDGRVTKESLRKKLIEGHPYAYKIYEHAIKNGIPIYHPFSDYDTDHGIPHLNIIGPSVNFYLNQLINFRSITDITEDSIENENFFKNFADAARKAINWISETWDEEKLLDPTDDATSSENNSSVISLFNFNGKKILFTADAGVLALSKAADQIETLGHTLQDFSFVQVPHHGSKRNIGPTILDRIIGKPKLTGSTETFIALISAAKEGEPKHPNKRVVNAFKRRGGNVIATQGITICHYTSGTPDRGWAPIEPLPFYTDIEDD